MYRNIHVSKICCLTEIDNKLVQYSEDTALNWMLQAARGLEYIHNLKYDNRVYRKIKPLNMLLDKEACTLKLCNLGTTTIMNKKEIMKKYETDAYMAPEILDGKYTKKCDVYSWAISLEYCLTREIPFSMCQGRTCFQICKKSEYYRSTNKKMFSLIKKSTDINPESRSSMAEIVKNLEECLNHFLQVRSFFGEFNIFSDKILVI